MKRYKITFFLLIILVLISLIIGFLVGFPWERIKAVNEVKKYVKYNYGLKPTKVYLTFSIDGMSGALVSTAELPFDFDVQISRYPVKVRGDLYLESLVEYHLERFIKKNVKALRNEQTLHVNLENRFSKNVTELTVEKVDSNPKIVLEEPTITYSCSIDGIEGDYENSFLIFKEITGKFKPTSIYFNYNNKKVYVCVKNNEYEKIHNASDLRHFESQ